MNKIVKLPTHKDRVIKSFSQKAREYDQNAGLQKQVVSRLVQDLPEMACPDVLEIGCGTGLLTRSLLEHYKNGRFLITDLSKPMLDQCQRACGSHAHIRYELMDGEAPHGDHKYDLIATGMTVQWFERPQQSLARLQSLLKPRGHLLYSTVGPHLFPQWRRVLKELDLPSGLVEGGEYPGEIVEEVYPVTFASGLEFLDSLRATGASTPHLDYRSMSPGALRRALRLFEKKMKCQADWHIIYGHLRAL